MSSHPTPVLFIPALLCDAAMYDDVITLLDNKIEPYVMLSPHARLQESVTDLLARAPEHFALVGTSYGGTLAMALALAAPDRVTSLWLMGCTAAAPASGGPDLAGGLDATPERVIDMLAGKVVHPTATREAAIFKEMAHRVGGVAGAAQARALAGRVDMTPQLHTLAMPTMVLWGKDDALVPWSAGRALADELPHAHFHTLDECGHLPTLEKPQECADLFGEFLHHAH